MSKFEFNTVAYRFAHGHEPRGRGTWAFFDDKRMDVARAIWSSPNVTFAEAKREFVRNMGPLVKHSSFVMVYVGT